MPSPNEISVSQLARLIGTPDTPILIDVRIDEDFAASPRLIPNACRRNFRNVQEWADDFQGSKAVVICQKGLKLSQGVVAWLRYKGIDALSLEGGFAAWERAGELLVDSSRITQRNAQGQSIWVTRARPKIDRIACPWLIRRFVDRNAVFLFVAPSEVLAVAERFGAIPFDCDDIFWSHCGTVASPEHTCTFDTMIAEFGLSTPALERLARIVRAADTARLDLAPQAAGLLAASLGLSRMYKDDLEQLDAGMLLYDAFYRWCRDAVDEDHNWPNPAKGR